MSVVYIKHHNENIYSVVQEKEVVCIESPRYVSKFHDSVKVEGKYKQLPHTYMGKPDLLPETVFLKKYHDRVPLVPKQPHRCLVGVKRPPVPPRPTVKRVKQKTPNCIFRNIARASNLKPIEVEKKFMDTRNGERHLVKTSGLEPFYIYQKKFGKVPKYLREEIALKERMEQEMKDQADMFKKTKCQYVSRHEREILLNGLKKNWESMLKEFQLLPIITDTTPKILRKSRLEKALAKLEKDITMIEKHPHIYIYEDK